MGLTPNAPKLAKAYRNLRAEISAGVDEWAKDVASGVFPGVEQSFK
jgi:3-methyl-2-oxobutanoate hydroxymethyltransferase